MKKYLLFLLIPVLTSGFMFAGDIPTILEKTAGMKAFKGFFNFYWDENEGKIWLEIEQYDEDFLYVDFLSQGLGSNDIGLDRGQIGPSRMVRFYRIGPKVLMIQPNLSYRADTKDHDEKNAVTESFAQSVIWGFKVDAEEDGKVLVDATSFFLNDNHKIAERIRRANQGNFSVDISRSSINPERTRSFPKNSEIDVILTFKGTSPGRWVRSVTPSPDLITMHMHHSFVSLPEPGYKPRAYDPRSGYINISYMDFAVPLGEPMMKRFIIRHRLEKKHPEAKMSEAVEPIVYYVDRAAPEPVRSALVEGASWWNEAFEAAGFKNAFQVKVLPPDADPLDVRYNVIMWVHRSTRGWSYGGSVVDPRTGEIIKGHVSLGSQRVRQDYLIAEGLLNPYKNGKPVSDKMRKMAIARIRQLAAHETGHTLGLVHNYIASTQNRASVMDYPAPYIKLDKNGEIDLSDAYDTGIGEWDKVTIDYGYQDFPEKVNEQKALNGIIMAYLKKGQAFLSDQDARPPGSAHPSTHLWDNGINAVSELNRMMEVRKKVLAEFTESAIPDGMPMATIEDVLVPAYMMHRYQIIAASKTIGGLEYTYAIKGDGQFTTRIVKQDEQRKAINALIRTIQPENLTIPQDLLSLIPPRPPGFSQTRELFPGYTGATFDPLGAAQGLVEITLSQLLNRERMARMVEYHARDEKYPGMLELVKTLLDRTWYEKNKTGPEASLQLMVRRVVLRKLMGLAADPNASDEVRSIAYAEIRDLGAYCNERMDNNLTKPEASIYIKSGLDIKRFLDKPDEFQLPGELTPPPGDPIGGF